MLARIAPVLQRTFKAICPSAQMTRLGVGFFIEILRGKAAISDRQTMPDHFAANIPPARYLANRNYSSVGVDIAFLTDHTLPPDQVAQSLARLDTAAETAAGLIALEGIDAEQADMPLANDKCITVDDIGWTGNDNRFG